MTRGWRVIPYAKNSAAYNMAIDEAIVRAVAKGKSPPTMRLYGWERNSVSIARQQNLDILHSPEALEVVRRPTGGNAVVHHENDLTYSIIAPRDRLPGTSHEVYESLLRQWIIPAINTLTDKDTSVELTGKNDVTLNGKKVCGNAQVLYTNRRVVLQQGAIFYARSQSLWAAYLKIPPKKLEQLTNLQTELGDDFPRNELLEQLTRMFTDHPFVQGTFTAQLSNYEKDLARRLEREIFERGTEWTSGTGAERTGTVCAIDVEDD